GRAEGNSGPARPRPRATAPTPRTLDLDRVKRRQAITSRPTRTPWRPAIAQWWLAISRRAARDNRLRSHGLAHSAGPRRPGAPAAPDRAALATSPPLGGGVEYPPVARAARRDTAEGLLE